MDKDAFEKSLPAFNSILVKNLNVSITQNFVKNSAMASYIYVKARLPETANSYRNEEGNEQTLEFTVSYDPFYNVPVFHFRVNMLLEHVSAPCAADIHPILQTPYLCVHLCETATTMDEWKPESPLDYMVKWIGMVFSLVLPEVQLRYSHTSPESRVICHKS
ncbi:hypothetical protein METBISCDRAFT_28339 [Metschnikowia bicuspidata]|uniref:Uncharacterized protein n=1 Tax=Metschnikowia bicuspidata TaxID=27322 RepID=A0A4P9ZB67_9ASCO|nr:hypothetical protein METBISCDRAFT_28339 [Metschnikowia bicuspidata]